MSNPNSVLEDLLGALPHLRPQMYFKSSLTALSHAIEDQVLAGNDEPLVIASFQQERFYRQEAHRYDRIARKSDWVYVLAASDTNFVSETANYNLVAFDGDDGLTREWHLVVLGDRYSICLVCRERSPQDPLPQEPHMDAVDMDTVRLFEGVWTFDRPVCAVAGDLLLERIRQYRPELTEKLARTRDRYNLAPQVEDAKQQTVPAQSVDPNPFAQRLVTYLQAGQYKLIKAYRSIAAQERKQRLVNSITAAIRESLNPEDILSAAAIQLGQTLNACRCLIYRCKNTDETAIIQHEYLGTEVLPLAGQTWQLQGNPLFRDVVAHHAPVYVADLLTDDRCRIADPNAENNLQATIQRWQIRRWLMVPVLHRGELLGMVEVHACSTCREPQSPWDAEDVDLVEAIATQIGVALIQAEAYANLEDLNQQLEALERTRSNLIAIIGHELRTPLSTIQVCLESLASDPDMPPEIQKIMIDAALEDGDRLRELVRDFLTLSRLESGRVEWHPEPIFLQECVDLAISGIHARYRETGLPQIAIHLPPQLPPIEADGEWLVQLLSKLIDNACKFTSTSGKVTVDAQVEQANLIAVTVADTGRGIEPNRLEAIFDRFYQEEGALRRTAGGTGLGLAICRQIVDRLGGKIWAESSGKEQGSQFHFTLPIVNGGLKYEAFPKATPSNGNGNGKAANKRRSAKRS